MTVPSKHGGKVHNKIVLVMGVTLATAQTGAQVVGELIGHARQVDVVYFGSKAVHAGSVGSVLSLPAVPMACGQGHDLTGGLQLAYELDGDLVVILTHGKVRTADEAVRMTALQSTRSIFMFTGPRGLPFEQYIQGLPHVATCGSTAELRGLFTSLIELIAPPAKDIRINWVATLLGGTGLDWRYGSHQDTLTAAIAQKPTVNQLVIVFVNKRANHELVQRTQEYVRSSRAHFIFISLDDSSRSNWLVELERLAEGRVIAVLTGELADLRSLVSRALHHWGYKTKR